MIDEPKCHPKTLAPANDQLQSRPATVYEDEAMKMRKHSEKGPEMLKPRGYYENGKPV